MDISATNAAAIPSMATNSSITASTKLRRAALDFEAILLGTWLQEIQESFSSAPGEESAGAENYRSLGIEAVAGALAASGGIGIARMVLRQLESSHPSGAAAVTSATGVP